jgi:uncharacterized protein YfdQ (DUF2303 family)
MNIKGKEMSTYFESDRFKKKYGKSELFIEAPRKSIKPLINLSTPTSPSHRDWHRGPVRRRSGTQVAFVGLRACVLRFVCLSVA